MGLRIKKVGLAFLTIIICTYCLVGCSAWGKNPVEAKYDTLPYENHVIKPEQWYDETEKKLHFINLKFGDSDIILLSTFDEYKAANIYNFEKSEDFFTENALLVMRYHHTSSDEMIEFVDIAIKDGKIYPVVSMDLPPNSNVCADIQYTLIIADVKKSDVEKYSFGEVLAINISNENDGSHYHEKFE